MAENSEITQAQNGIPDTSEDSALTPSQDTGLDKLLLINLD